MNPEAGLRGSPVAPEGETRPWFRAGASTTTSAGRTAPEELDSVLTEQAPLQGQENSWFHSPWPAPRPAGVAASRAGRSLARLFRTYAGARAVVGLLLAVLHYGSSMMGASPQAGALVVSGLYALQVSAVAFWVWRVGGRSLQPMPPGMTLMALTVGADVLAFVALLAI
ncbi:MAG: hypothetical protein ACKOD9_04825, partial [Rubrivivax sp.]